MSRTEPWSCFFPHKYASPAAFLFSSHGNSVASIVQITVELSLILLFSLMPTFNPSGDHVGSVLRLYPVSDYFLPLPCHLSGLSHHHFSHVWWTGKWLDMVRKGIKRWCIMTQMYSLAVLDSSLKSRCQQGCIHSGGFSGKSVSVPFQLLEAAYIPWLGVPPSHQSCLCPHISSDSVSLYRDNCDYTGRWELHHTELLVVAP